MVFQTRYVHIVFQGNLGLHIHLKVEYRHQREPNTQWLLLLDNVYATFSSPKKNSGSGIITHAWVVLLPMLVIVTLGYQGCPINIYQYKMTLKHLDVLVVPA